LFFSEIEVEVDGLPLDSNLEGLDDASRPLVALIAHRISHTAGDRVNDSANALQSSNAEVTETPARDTCPVSVLEVVASDNDSNSEEIHRLPEVGRVRVPLVTHPEVTEVAESPARVTSSEEIPDVSPSQENLADKSSNVAATHTDTARLNSEEINSIPEDTHVTHLDDTEDDSRPVPDSELQSSNTEITETVASDTCPVTTISVEDGCVRVPLDTHPEDTEVDRRPLKVTESPARDTRTDEIPDDPSQDFLADQTSNVTPTPYS
jgi:hypothetical protein